MMVQETLTEIENWFNEPTSGSTRTNLLSKLAIIEFCGWLEEWMDDVIYDLDGKTTSDRAWTEMNVVKNTSGFSYNNHFRPMLCKILGEHRMRRVETDFEKSHPGDLDFIKRNLTELWKLRCNLAHANMAAHKSAQITINAPSWTKNQHRLLSKKLGEFRSKVVAAN